MILKDYFMIIILMVGIVIASLSVVHESMAIEILDSKEQNKKLLFNDDREILCDNLYKFIDNYDNYLIGLSSFRVTSKLRDNYNYYLEVAANYILDNVESFDIIDNWALTTDVYDVVNNIFGVSYFYIDGVKNGRVLLIKNKRRFSMVIKKVELGSWDNDKLEVMVTYNKDDFDMDYKFYFDIKDKVMFVDNIEVV